MDFHIVVGGLPVAGCLCRIHHVESLAVDYASGLGFLRGNVAVLTGVSL